jgi:hypothetical protein
MTTDAEAMLHSTIRTIWSRFSRRDGIRAGMLAPAWGRVAGK